MPNFLNYALLQKDFDDIETYFDLRVFEQTQIVESCARKARAPFLVYRCGGARPLLGRTGFYFDEHKTVGLAKHQVHFAAIRTKVLSEEFQAIAFQMFSG